MSVLLGSMSFRRAVPAVIEKPRPQTSEKAEIGPRVGREWRGGILAAVSLILYLLLAALSGLVVGALARLLVPGPDPMTILETILVGIAGTMIAAAVAYYVL